MSNDSDRERRIRNGASEWNPDRRTTTDGESTRGTRRTEGRNGEADGLVDPAEVRRLRAENERLRERYAQTRRSKHRRTALGLAVVGLLAGGVAALVPMVRGPLVAVAATGVFAAVLTWYLTPERFVPADVGEAVVSPLLRNERAIVDRLNLSDRRTYVRTEDGPRVYVPRTPVEGVPSDAELDGPFVVTDDATTSGVALVPSGAELYREFAETDSADGVTEPEAVVARLTEAVVETFELARSAESSIETTADGARATVELSEPAFGPSADFDHPVGSFLAIGLATEFGTSVTAETSQHDSGMVVLNYRWSVDRRATDDAANESVRNE
ncbi:hypothetical protein [Halopelagius longus]|uniref:DUF7982 domain-containing protein n=1 Tax=Halopelagius longus TaxID=1236180 RepID=A0A1H1GKL0_9EURY|nr:hypothetical protein [Halopelagius longus]RDI69686.1 hypothetical protein DWB78_18115 [Halopelagius longus]SDR13677.1 hypothetical protein SAMN05216278_3731 [Halopelagius longus]